MWLLALLALRAGRDVDRDWLAAELWPECGESSARRSLRQSLHDLRQALGPEAGRIHSAGPRTLSLDPDGVYVDVLAFDAAAADDAHLEQAVRLYDGPFMEGCTEEWCIEERRSRELIYVEALARLAREASQRADRAGAAHFLRLAVSADPFREDLQLALMQALADGGRPTGALLVYREYRNLLSREMAAEPLEEMMALFRLLRDRTRPAAAARRRDARIGGSLL